MVPRAVSSTFSSKPAGSIKSVAAATLLHELLNPTVSPTSLAHIHKALISTTLSTPGTVARLYIAAALTPYSGITYIDSKHKTKLAVEGVIREGLKLGAKNHCLDGIPPLFTAAEVLEDRIKNMIKPNMPSERVAIGRWSAFTFLLSSLSGSCIYRLVAATKMCSQPSHRFSLDSLFAVFPLARAGSSV